MHLGDVLSTCYDQEVAALRDIPPLPNLGYAGHAWEYIVSEAQVSTGTLRSALWLRSSPYFSVVPKDAYCPYCSLPVRNWAYHFQLLCPRALVATAAGFQAILQHLQLTGWTPTPISLWSARCVNSHGDSLEVILSTDSLLTAAPQRCLCCSWSGLIWVQGAGDARSTAPSLNDCRTLSVAYLDRFHRFVSQSDVVDTLLADTALIAPFPPW